jgi:hypothetical protein
VALKIVKLGMDTRAVIARFEQERQALAMMDHPNILMRCQQRLDFRARAGIGTMPIEKCPPPINRELENLIKQVNRHTGRIGIHLQNP